MIKVLHTPQINTNDDRVEVVTWHKAHREYVEIGQDILDVETSKSVVTLAAESNGFLDQLVASGNIVRVGAPLYRIADAVEEIDSAADVNQGESSAHELSEKAAAPLKPREVARDVLPSNVRKTPRFSRAARDVIRLKGLSEADFPAGGLMTSRSISAKSCGLAHAAEPARDRLERVSLGKQGEIEALSLGQLGNINSTLSIQFSSAAIRRRLKAEGICDGSVQPLILFEISRLLQTWRQFTAFFDNESVIYYDRVDLGLAVDLGHGLKVVTIKAADSLMPLDFHERVLDIGQRYLEKQLKVDELSNSTITVTDLSAFDILHFLPLINGRQSAIIGIGSDSEQSGHPMSIIVTFDHRVTNGRDVAAFLRELRTRILSYADGVCFSRDCEASQPLDGTHAAPAESVACDFCSIDLRNYYSQFGKSAHMLAYYREDGTLGSVCHRCLACWT
jgi:2-oxoglutarate dehydrogenase E2 component (dihydrolipoamide succinyltransferase)